MVRSVYQITEKAIKLKESHTMFTPENSPRHRVSILMLCRTPIYQRYMDQETLEELEKEGWIEKVPDIEER